MPRPGASASTSARHCGAALAEADGDIALASGGGAERDLIAILQKTPRLAGGQRQRRLAALRDLQQGTITLGVWRGDRAGAEEIAGLKVATVGGVMGEQLRGSPVKIARRAQRQAMRRQPSLAHRA